MEDYKIIDFNQSDKSISIEQLKSIYLKLFNNPKNIKYLSFTSIPFTDDLVNNFITSASESGISYILAIDNNDIVGIAIIKQFIIEGFEILGLCVQPEYQRKGIGEQLIKYSENKAKINEYKSIKVSVFTDNKKMLRLLLKLDYIPTKIYYKMRYDGMDVLELIKYL